MITIDQEAVRFQGHDGQEPPGRWWGNAAEDLGFSGEIDAEKFLAMMAGRDPVTSEVLGRRYREGRMPRS